MDNNELVRKFIILVGGKQNISNIYNCYTRVRVNVKDINLVKKDELSSLPNIIGVVVEGSQAQIIVGPGKSAKLAVLMKEENEKNNEFTTNNSLSSNFNVDISTSKDIAISDGNDFSKTKEKIRSKHNSKANSLIKKISGIFVPIIPAFIVCGLLLGIHETIKTAVPSYSESNIGIIMGIVSTAVFDILNVIVGYNATKEFGGDGIIGGMLGAILSNSLLSNVSFGSFKLEAGRGGVISIIFVAIAAAYFEKLLRKFIPEMIDSFVTPLLTVVVMTIAGIFVFQPLGGWISDGVAFVVNNIITYCPYLLGVVPLFYLFLVLTGTHHSLMVISQTLIDTTGKTFLLPVQLMAGAAEVGSAVHIALTTKNKKLKKRVLQSIPVGVLGIDEPLIWGMSVPLKRPFIAASIGGFAGGTFIACMKLWARVPESTGIEAALVTNSPLLYCLGFAISIVAGFLISLLVGYRDPIEVKDKDSQIVKEIYEERSYFVKLKKKLLKKSHRARKREKVLVLAKIKLGGTPFSKTWSLGALTMLCNFILNNYLLIISWIFLRIPHEYGIDKANADIQKKEVTVFTSIIENKSLATYEVGDDLSDKYKEAKIKPLTPSCLFSAFSQKKYSFYLKLGAKKIFKTILLLLCGIVPGIIYFYKTRYAVKYASSHSELSCDEVLKKSMILTEGDKMDLFILDLLMFPLYILGLLALIVGVFYVNYFHKLLVTYYYERRIIKLKKIEDIINGKRKDIK